MATTNSVDGHRSRIDRPLIVTATSLIVAMVTASPLISAIINCHRRLVKFFATCFTTTTKPSKVKVKKDFILPPHNKDQIKKKTIFLDLDETLVHCTTTIPDVRFDFTIRPKINGQTMMFFVVKRPGLDQFLEKIGEKYEVVVFTAGISQYATPLLDRIDKKGVISHRLFRDSCTEVDGKYVKDLVATGRDLENVVIVDDNTVAYAWQPENALPIKPFVNDMKDEELKKLVDFFDDCLGVEDTRVAVKELVNKNLLLS